MGLLRPLPERFPLQLGLGPGGQFRPSLLFCRDWGPLFDRGARWRDDVLHHVALVLRVALAGGDGHDVACAEGIVGIVYEEGFGVVEELGLETEC